MLATRKRQRRAKQVATPHLGGRVVELVDHLLALFHADGAVEAAEAPVVLVAHAADEVEGLGVVGHDDDLVVSVARLRRTVLAATATSEASRKGGVIHAALSLRRFAPHTVRPSRRSLLFAPSHLSHLLHQAEEDEHLTAPLRADGLRPPAAGEVGKELVDPVRPWGRGRLDLLGVRHPLPPRVPARAGVGLVLLRDEGRVVAELHEHLDRREAVDLHETRHEGLAGPP